MQFVNWQCIIALYEAQTLCQLTSQTISKITLGKATQGYFINHLWLSFWWKVRKDSESKFDSSSNH